VADLGENYGTPTIMFGRILVLICSRYFRDQYLQHPQQTDAHLVLWYFEDWLKKLFFSLLQILEVRRFSQLMDSIKELAH
jgi:hypothetical protein